FKPYYEMALRMQNDDKTCMDFGTLKTANLHYNSVFPDGSVAMMPMGTWFAATMIDKINKGESSVNWGIATLPHPEGVDAGYVADLKLWSMQGILKKWRILNACTS
ncbi:hypothetical protein, partial [Helicobacter typhlonius]|uniref:hypothetical protein n=1 Tax=Helicobacter typhlonius TaxID=76936 RepID=UPI002FE10697